MAVAAATGVTGAAADFAVGLYDRYNFRRSRSAVAALEQAGEIVGGLDILNERTAVDDERLELAAKVVEAAATTTMSAKVSALARVLVDGVDPNGDVNEATVMALALRDLEAPHVRLLQIVALPHVDLAATDMYDAQRRSRGVEGWTATDLRFVLESGVFDSVLAVLVRHGLVSDEYSGTYEGLGADHYNLTSTGDRCLFLLGHDVGYDD